jgi:GNAT superfamily N-acetyltransferase
VFEDAVAQNGFVGVAARTGDTGELVGFSWGFSVPSVDSPSVLFSQVSPLFREQGIEASTTFYAAETGLLPDFQQRGEGKRLMLARFREAREAGFLGMCGRTINPKIVKIYEDCFGEENVRVVFHDPDPVKADRKWYYAPLSALRSKTD